MLFKRKKENEQLRKQNEQLRKQNEMLKVKNMELLQMNEKFMDLLQDSKRLLELCDTCREKEWFGLISADFERKGMYNRELNNENTSKIIGDNYDTLRKLADHYFIMRNDCERLQHKANINENIILQWTILNEYLKAMTDILAIDGNTDESRNEIDLTQYTEKIDGLTSGTENSETLNIVFACEGVVKKLLDFMGYIETVNNSKGKSVYKKAEESKYERDMYQ